MAYDLKDKLVIAISSRALFSLEEENSIFDKEGLEAYYDYQLSHLDDPLSKGSAFRFVQNLLSIKFTADYALSKNLNALFFYDHSFSKFAVSTAFPQTTINTGITLRYNFGN